MFQSRLARSLLAGGHLVSGALVLPTSSEPSDLQFLSERTTLRLGTHQVVSFRVEPAVEDRTFPVSAPKGVDVEDDAYALAGEEYGFVELRARAGPGGVLAIGGDELMLEIETLDTEAPVRTPVPKIVAPAQGSSVYGAFAVGVELPPLLDESLDDDLVLEVSDAHGGAPMRLTPARRVGEHRGPERRHLFELDASEFAPGALRIVATTDCAARSHAPRSSEPLVLHVAAPASEDVLAFEVEDLATVPRPEGFGTSHPALARDPDASQSAAVVIRAANPLCLVPLDVPASGTYQAIVTLRGTLGAGAFPTLALAKDTPYSYVASVRAIDRRWHRMPLGAPIALDAGEVLLGLRHANAVREGRRERRDLYIDRLELFPVKNTTSAPPDASAMAMAMTMEGATSAAPAASGGLWVAFDRVFDGLPMNGRFSVSGVAACAGSEDAAPPTVELLVDGEVHRTQQSTTPLFRIAPTDLGGGEHSIALRAHTADGRSAETPIQTLLVAPRFERSDVPARLRIGPRDGRWRVSGASTLERPEVSMSATLELPEDLAGTFDVFLDARGPGRPEHAVVTTSITGPDGVVAENVLEVRNYWRERPLFTVELEPGPKRIDLAVDLEHAGEDRPFRLRGVIFERARETIDRAPPAVEIAYPRADAVVGTTDAVVARVSDDRAVHSIEVLVDGRATGLFGRAGEGAGYALCPLFTDDLAPGEHSLSVRVLDRARNEAVSREITIQVRPKARSDGPAESERLARAVFLLDRLAYGPEPRELAEILVLGEETWLERALEFETGHDVARGAGEAMRSGRVANDAARLALRTALLTDQPLRERFTLFVENHFSTWGRKTGMPSEWREHRTFQDLGFAPFSELLLATVTSPNMLVYLDQQESFRGRLNENLARELLELHTVGVNGGYTQDDVTDLAGILCGLTVSEEAPESGAGDHSAREFRFTPDLADPVGADVMGMRFGDADARAPGSGLERVRAVAAHLAAHPATARFWSTKIAEHYASVPAPPELVEALEATFHATAGDSRAMLRTLATHPSFFACGDEPRVATPLDFGLRFARATSPSSVHYQVERFLRSAGMGMFDRISPDGYPEGDEHWVDANALLSRWTFVSSIPWAARSLVPDDIRRDAGDAPDVWRQRAIDHVAFGLLGRRLGEESNAAAHAFLSDLESERHAVRVNELSLLVTRLPEANLR